MYALLRDDASVDPANIEFYNSIEKCVDAFNQIIEDDLDDKLEDDERGDDEYKAQKVTVEEVRAMNKHSWIKRSTACDDYYIFEVITED